MPVPVRKYGRVVIDPELQAGTPVIAGIHLTVSAMGCFEAGYSVDDVIKRYPYLTREDVVSALHLAAVLVDQSNPQIPGDRGFAVG